MFCSINVKRERGHEVFLPNATTCSEIIDLSDANDKFVNHQNKCRCCFEPFGISSMKIMINASQRKTFNKLTGVELLEDLGYSKFLCLKCITEMKKCQEFIEKSTNLQKEFYNFVSANYTIKAEYGHFEPEIVQIDVDPPDLSILDNTNRFNCTKQCSVKIKRVNLDDFDVDMHYFESKSNSHSFSYQFNFDDNDSICSFGDDQLDRFSNSSSTRQVKPKPPKPKRPPKPKSISRKHLKAEERRMFCDKCDWNSMSRKRMMQHVINHLKLYKIDSLCSFCGKKFTTTIGLTLHIKRYHEAVAKKIECSICKVEVDTNFLLERHMLWYHPTVEKEFKCGKCELSYFTEGALTRHDQLVHDVKVKCRVLTCKKLFYDNIAEGSHYIKFHKEEKNVSLIEIYIF